LLLKLQRPPALSFRRDSLTLPYTIAATHRFITRLAGQHRKDQKGGIQIRRIEIFCSGEFSTSRGGAQSENDIATFTASLLTASTSDWLAPPVALSCTCESPPLCTASKPEWRWPEQSGFAGACGCKPRSAPAACPHSWLGAAAAALEPRQFAQFAEHVNAYTNASDKIATTNRVRIPPLAPTTETIAPPRTRRKRALFSAAK
jgi:hypothetical protein